MVCVVRRQGEHTGRRSAAFGRKYGWASVVGPPQGNVVANRPTEEVAETDRAGMEMGETGETTDGSTG